MASSRSQPESLAITSFLQAVALPPSTAPDQWTQLGSSSDVASPEAGPDLTALLISAGMKDEAAFRDLYTACSRRVFGQARRVLIDPDISAEVTQEVFLLVWEQGDRYDPELGHPLTWLKTLTHRRAIDRLRSEVSRGARDEKWGRRHHATPVDEVSEVVVGRDEASRVHASMSVLSNAQHEAISLAFFSHLTYAEVGERLGIPVATAKTRIRDGLKKLRKALEPHARE
ncbi:sigma-70 family RNA polymerase sigma factor [Arthrobacter agilis]|uniref:sigma-70 family RNA polymerase sigma factor n=1 Tax=Arthrobacter agilis TaxID=37921 RepID=UPI002366A533|nr:sigma-70 family RNA polymerase sigma factor [Arthrobacter agilis]WDF33271.1 sigma-70 family RNA polymerase sigma factor [Arthrobacter agilis]